MLCARLVDMYEEFQRRRTVDLVKFYTDKIEALRRECIALRASLRTLQQPADGASGGEPTDAGGLRALPLLTKLEKSLQMAIEARVLVTSSCRYERFTHGTCVSLIIRVFASVQRDEEQAELLHSFKQLYNTW